MMIDRIGNVIPTLGDPHFLREGYKTGVDVTLGTLLPEAHFGACWPCGESVLAYATLLNTHLDAQVLKYGDGEHLMAVFRA